ncbi:MAG: type II secretion system F family protein [Syntrophomonadaceae bacterium]|nr:type II secretion system F family protein [Syntrophomonadaceae bacterium]
MKLDSLQYLVMFFTFGAVYSIVLFIGYLKQQRQLRFLKRLDPWLERKKTVDPLREKLERPLSERLIKPGLKQLTLVFGKWINLKTSSELPHRLMKAGSPWGMSPSEFIALQYAATLVFAVAALLLSVFITPEVSVRISIATFAAVAGYMLPDLILRFKIDERKEAAVRSLPDALDLLTVSVEAGLGFDIALQKVAEKSQGVLGSEFTRLLSEIRMGKPRREALRDLTNRIGGDELASLVSAIIQADQLGVSMGNVLRLQAAQLRQQRRQRAEEKAMKAPVKMLFPLVFFIFPTIFIVLLGPAIIKFATGFRF